MAFFKLLTFVFISILPYSSEGARILTGSKMTLRKEDSTYKNNRLGCADDFLKELLPMTKRSKIDHAEVQKECDANTISCCSSDEVKSLIEMTSAGKKQLAEQAKSIASFVDFASSLDAKKFADSAPITEEIGNEAPDSLEYKEKIEKIANERASFESLLKNDLKVSKVNIDGYFNNLSMSQSGLICQACNSKFGSFFFSKTGNSDPSSALKLEISKDHCMNHYDNENRMIGFLAQLEMMLKVVEKQGIFANEDEFKSEYFNKQLMAAKDQLNRCRTSDDEFTDLTDEEIVAKEKEKETKTTGESQINTDTGVELPKSKMSSECENLCRRFLPFSPVRFMVDPFPMMNYLISVLDNFANEGSLKKPETMKPAEPVVFFEKLQGKADNVPLFFRPNALFFYNFPVKYENFKVVDIEEIKLTNMSKKEIVSTRELTIWQKIYNFLFGWFLTPYEL